VERSLESAHFDDDLDGGLAEARQEAIEGKLVAHGDLKRDLGLR
jgi:hypothetical protein